MALKLEIVLQEWCRQKNCLYLFSLYFYSITPFFCLELFMNSGKKCFFEEDTCLEDYNFVLTLKINMKPPVKKYFEEFANKLLLV